MAFASFMMMMPTMKKGDCAMKVFFSAAIVAVLLSLPSMFVAIAGGEQPAPLGNLQVKSVSVAEIDTAHVKIAVDLTLIPSQSVTLNDLRLCSLRLNGLPVFAAPVDQEIVLKKGVPTTIPSISVTVMFRDLYAVEPLRKIIAEQNVHVQGDLEAAVRLNFAEKLALHTQHPTVQFAISQDVPAEVGGSPIQRAMELAMLSVIDSGLEAKARADKMIPGAEPDWVRSLDEHGAASLFDVQTSYSLNSKESGDSALVSNQLGFRLTSAAVLTTAEAREPWRYDLEVLDALKGGTAKLVKQSLDMQLLPINAPATALKLGAKDFDLEARGNPEEISSVTSNKNQIQVLRRASPSAITLLKTHSAAAAPGLAPAPAAIMAQDAWSRVAVFRLRLDPSTQMRSVEVLQLSARRDGKGIQLSDPVDSAVFGSPIVTADGVIGLVQDEQAGTFLPADLLAAAAALPAQIPSPSPAQPPAQSPASDPAHAPNPSAAPATQVQHP
jgi:hypothetical protein